MTAQPTRDQLRAEAQASIDHDGPNAWAGIGAADLLALLDQIDQQEATMRRQDRYIEELEIVDAVGLTAHAETAKARIKSVRDVLDAAILRDGTEERELAHRIRRALDG